MSRKPQRVLEGLKIQTLGAKGKAIGKTEEGRVVFIPYVAPGDIVDARVVKKRKNYLEAEAIAIKSDSEYRVEPKCEHFTRCGGCKWQHLQYDQQLIYKQNEVLENLKRIGEINPEIIEPIMASETIYHYRNKMEFSFSDSRWIEKEEIESGETFDRRGLGFHKPGMWDKIIDLNNCYLQGEPSNRIRTFCKEEGIRQELEFFNPRNRTGALRTLMIRNTLKNVKFPGLNQDI